MSLPPYIGPYEVLRPIAQGGMAEVFEVVDVKSGEKRALKLLTEPHNAVRRFNREFEALTRINHPGIVRVYRFGIVGEQPWMTMELLEGLQLQERMSQIGAPGDPARTEEVLRIGFFLAQALQYIHDRGLVHRDLKSANVQILKDGRVKLLDFGTVHLRDPLDRITQDTDFIGTFSYAAPEQIVGGPIDHRVDLYAFGVLLYRLITGRRPFKHSDPHEVARMHLYEQAKPAKVLVPGIPSELDELIAWLMRKQRTERPDRADDVARILEKIAGQPPGLRGNGLALSAGRSPGREVVHRELWARLSEVPSGSLVMVTGSDAPERRGVLRQFTDDAVIQGWQAALAAAPILAYEHESAPAGRELSRALSALVMGDSPAAMRLREILEGPWSSRPDVLLSLVPAWSKLLASQSARFLLIIDGLDRFPAVYQALLGRLLFEAGGEGRTFVMLASCRHGAPVLAGEPSVLQAATTVIEQPLSRLDLRSTALAAAQILQRRPPPPENARRIFDVTAGQPTLIGSVLESMVAQGAITVESPDGARIEWQRDEGDDALPEVVCDAVATGLAGWSVAQLRLAELLALMGDDVPVEALSHGLGMPLEPLAFLLQPMLEDGRLEGKAAAGERIRQPDALLSRYLVERMAPHRRALWVRRIAAIVARMEPSFAQVRILFEAGQGALAVERALEVAARLLRRGRAGEGVKLLDLVESAVLSASKPHQLRYHVLYAACLHRVRPMDPRSMKAVHIADGLAQDDAGRAFVRFEQSELNAGIGHYVNQRKMLDEAWALLEDSPPGRLRGDVVLELADLARTTGQLTEAARWAELAVDNARESNDREIFDRGRVILAYVRLASGDLQAAERMFADVIETERMHPDPAIRHHATAGWGHVLRRQGRYSEALVSLSDAVAEARHAQSTPAWVDVALSAALVELDLYRLGRAQEFAEEVASAMGPGERLASRLDVRMVLGRIALASGQYAMAAYQFQDVASQSEKAGFLTMAASARGFEAEARWTMGMKAEAVPLYQKSLMDLVRALDMGALADVVVSRARAVGVEDDPTKAFMLARKLDENWVVFQIEKAMAMARWSQQAGGMAGVLWAEVHKMVDALSAKLDPIEQSAIRVHPWTHELHRHDVEGEPAMRAP